MYVNPLCEPVTSGACVRRNIGLRESSSTGMPLGFVVVLLALAATVAPASAATVSLRVERPVPCAKGCEEITQVRFVAADGERNDVVVSEGLYGVVTFTDAGAPLRAGEGCSADPDGSAVCRARGLRDIELSLGDADDRLDARTGVRADSGSGSDRLTGGGTLDGGPGDDVLVGSGILVGGLGADRLEGGDGPQSLTGDPAAGPFSPDVMHGGGGVDTVAYERRATPVVVDLATAEGQGGAGENDVVTGVENVVGSDASDVLRGDEGPNRLDGERLSAPITGGSGDVIDGRGGVDLLWGGSGPDALDGGAGDDEVWGHGGRDRVAGGDGDDRLLPGTYEDPGDRMACGAGRDRTVRPDVRDIVAADCEATDIAGDSALHAGPPRRAAGGGFLVEVSRTVVDSPPSCRFIVRVIGARSTRVSEQTRLARTARRTVRVARRARRPPNVPAPPRGYVRVVAQSRDCNGYPSQPVGFTVAVR